MAGSGCGAGRSQEFAQSESRRLQIMRRRAADLLRDAATRVLSQILRERGGKLLLDESQVILSADELDITEIAITRLDAEAPEIPLDAQPSAAEQP